MNFSQMLAKKPVEDVINESKSGHLKRSLGAWNLISLGIGAVIGSGIFVIVGTASALHAGPAIVLSFILAGIASGFTALCYAELASTLPVSGSAYTYSYVSLGEIFAWIMGWLLILEYGVSSATVAVGWSGYFNSLLSSFGMQIPPQFSAARGEEVLLANGETAKAVFNLPAFIIVWIVTGILTLGVKESANANNAIVVLKVAIIIIFIAAGISYIDYDNWQPFIPENTGKSGEFGYSGVLSAAGTIFFAYIGFEAVSTASQESKNPQRDIPVGIIGSLLFCTLLYILVSAVLTGVVHYSELNVSDPIALGIDRMNMPNMAIAVKAGALLGLTSVMLVTMYGQTRVFYIMAKDGLLPSVFAKVHKRFQTPYVNTFVVGLFLSTAAATTPIKELGDLVSMGTLIAFSVVCFSVMYLRKKQPSLPRPFRCPGMPIVPILGILMCLALASGLPANTFKMFGAWFAIGLLVYFLYGRHHSRRRLVSK